MRSTTVALGFYFAAVICSALAQPGDAIAAACEATPGIKALDEIDDAKGPRFDEDRKDHDNSHRKRDRSGDGFKHDEEYGLELVAQLSALETRLGIRSEQLDTWRDYTTALQSLLAPIRPEKLTDPRDNPQAEVHGPKDPFDREQKLADELIQRAADAEKLNAAIAALRTILTPRQLDELAALNRSD